MGRGGKKSRRRTSYCSMYDREGAANGCRKKANVATMRDGMCLPCWQKQNAKALNRTHNMWSFEGSKKRLLELPVDAW